MGTYVNISKEEMEEFFSSLEFKKINPEKIYSISVYNIRPDLREIVYGKLETCGEMKVTVRVFTSLPAEGGSVRKKGADAIRIVVVGKDKHDRIHPISKPKRVYRTTNWRDNLRSALNNWKTLIKYKCFTCGSPMTFHCLTKQLLCSFCLTEDILQKEN